ncbi:MAG: GGDEF domain-containing protein, partial [Myxococcota bacterium]
MAESDNSPPFERPTRAPLSETLPPGVPVRRSPGFDDDPYAESSVVDETTPFDQITSPLPSEHHAVPAALPSADRSVVAERTPLPSDRSVLPDRVPLTAELPVAPGEALQFVRYTRTGSSTLKITGLTPHGRRLTFEQREDRDGWYVVAAGRRRRPTKRELGLVVASITQEMEAAMAPEGDHEVRSAFLLAYTSDQPGIAIRGLQAYRDLLLDEAAAYIGGQSERLAVVAVEYQSFKRFAIRHGHRIGAAFVMALGERLQSLFQGHECVAPCHRTGKSFRLIVRDCSSAEIHDLVAKVTADATREWIVQRVWGEDQRTHPDEVNFYIGIAAARANEREGEDFETLAQRLNDDAYRAAKLGQLLGYSNLTAAKTIYRTTVYQWNRNSDDELSELAAKMDDGPAEVMAEMSDFLHELVPADLEGMAVQGDLQALVHKAIARDGFWQGTTAMRIAGDRLFKRFLENTPAPPDQLDYVGGFDLGDEFYG